MRKLSKENDYINDAMEHLGMVHGFDIDDVSDEDAEKIRQKADEVMSKAYEDFEAFLDTLGYKRAMGEVAKKEK